jgi:hypothetical protein
MAAFFDSSLADSLGTGFIREDKIDAALTRLIAGAYLSKGQYSCPGRAEARDLVWNHMDQNHRPFLHRTYDSASRLYIDRRASFALTHFGRWPVVIPVFDGYFKENGFYQVMVLFGLIAVVTIIECNRDDSGTRMDVRWTIASHRWLRFLHPLLHKRFTRLNEIQNAEDEPVRARRVELRAAGYRFKTDDPDFVNSNVIENNTIFPPADTSQPIVLGDLPDRVAVRVAAAERAFVLRRNGQSVDVWPGVCPHEGAELAACHLRDSTMACPWHGLEFPPRRLAEGGGGVTVCGARLDLADGRILVKAASI